MIRFEVRKFAIFLYFCDAEFVFSSSDRDFIHMPETGAAQSISPIDCFSSATEGVWLEKKAVGAYESWRFDALSDDGREVLIVTFTDNFPLSPRYMGDVKDTNGNGSAPPTLVPAVSFIYALDGQIVINAVNEYGAAQFERGEGGRRLTIGGSSFRADAAAYGSGYLLTIDIVTRRKRRITAELEWLSIESDLLASKEQSGPAQSSWNMAAPRSDVSGRITLSGRRGNTRKVVHFRGTGYHDHFRTNQPMASDTAPRCWGRAHFVDSTAVFMFSEGRDRAPGVSKLFLVRDGDMHERNTVTDVQQRRRDRYGLLLPRRLTLLSEDNIRLRAKQVQVIRSGLFETKMLSEMTLMLRDGKPRKTIGISEYIMPGRMKSRLFRWLTGLEIVRNA